jgi:predicted nucleic acid-binding protein
VPAGLLRSGDPTPKRRPLHAADRDRVILVDTSVWIDHLRNSERQLVTLLGRDEVACHPFVVEELALGSIKERSAFLDSLAQLRSVPLASHAEVRTLVESNRLWGRGLSAIDVQLLASVLIEGVALLWSRDKRLLAAAGDVGVAVVDWR